MTVRAIYLVAVVACLTGCPDDDGTVSVTAYGEEFIEEGIPEGVMQDGWTVEFERFDAVFSDARIAGKSLDNATKDLTKPSMGKGQTLGSVSVPAGEYDDVAFTIDQLVVVGEAIKGSQTVGFDWVLDAPTSYEHCESSVTVPEGGKGTFQITLHGDHLFYDSLVAEEPNLRFQLLADADTNGDGVITQIDLEGADLGDYDGGSDGVVADLWGYLLAASASVGHANGESHCHSAPAD